MIRYRNILEVGPEIQEKVRLWRNSARVRRGMLAQGEISAEQHQTWLEFLQKNTPRHKVRVAFADQTPFGVVSLRDIDGETRSCDWGFYLGEASFLGKKLGLRLIYDVQSWGFEGEGVEKMYSSVRADNLKVLHRELEAGYHIEGLLKRHLRRTDGALIDLYLIAQFRDTWRTHKETIASWGLIGETQSL